MVNYFVRKYRGSTLVDSSFSVFETWERQRMNEELAKDRSEQWLRENIVSELAFVKNQRKLWLAQLEEAKKNGDVEMIARKERDLKFNEKNLDHNVRYFVNQLSIF